MLSIDNHVTLKAQALEEFGLSFWSSSRHGNNSLWLDGVYSDLELLDLHINQLSLAFDLKFQLFLDKCDLIFILLFNKLKISSLFDPLRVNLELSLIDLSLSLD